MNCEVFNIKYLQEGRNLKFRWSWTGYSLLLILFGHYNLGSISNDVSSNYCPKGGQIFFSIFYWTIETHKAKAGIKLCMIWIINLNSRIRHTSKIHSQQLKLLPSISILIPYSCKRIHYYVTNSRNMKSLNFTDNWFRSEQSYAGIMHPHSEYSDGTPFLYGLLIFTSMKYISPNFRSLQNYVSTLQLPKTVSKILGARWEKKASLQSPDILIKKMQLFIIIYLILARVNRLLWLPPFFINIRRIADGELEGDTAGLSPSGEPYSFLAWRSFAAWCLDSSRRKVIGDRDGWTRGEWEDGLAVRIIVIGVFAILSSYGGDSKICVGAVL